MTAGTLQRKTRAQLLRMWLKKFGHQQVLILRPPRLMDRGEMMNGLLNPDTIQPPRKETQ